MKYLKASAMAFHSFRRPGRSRQFRHVLFVGLMAGAPLVGWATPVLPGIGAAMQKEVLAQEVAGAVTLVTTKDKIVHLEATGFADLEAKKAMEPDAMFWLASTTKMVTGLAVLMLQDEGKLNVADPVAKYIPEFASLRTPSGKPANITIAQLLTHTSGLAEINQAAYASVKNLTQLIGGYFPAPPLKFEPGAQYAYTSFGFDVAGRIVEVASGRTFDDFLQERLFDPLAMKDTTFYPTDAQQRRLASNYARNRSTGLLERRPTLPPGMSRPLRGQVPPVPAGGLFSTAEDLARLGQMLLNRGVLDGRRYLSETSYRVLTTVQAGDLPTPERGWGMGVYIVRVPHEGTTATLSAGAFGHPGAAGTHVIIDPVKGVAYVMLVQRPNLPSNFENEPIRVFLQAAAEALASNPPPK